MISLRLLITFAVATFASDFGKTCRDEHIDPNTEVLSASCDTGDGRGTLKSTSINLNDCFGWSDNKIQQVRQGHFGDTCDDCFSYRVPDPLYGVFGVTRVWMNCICNGGLTDSSINLDSTLLTNKFGTLVCTR
ncbi:cvnh domain-containing protein [Colletotrichum truncatum]|uniref:Cvnh domain-containing protein n=1 Tax=Colletotrichum truncatum TaxID=5467 RepID=A0ACC3YPQ6_COLTU